MTECKLCGNDKKMGKCRCSLYYTDCDVCGSKVKKTAKKCLHCHHWIDGSTFFSRSTKVIKKNIKDTKIPEFFGNSEKYIREEVKKFDYDLLTNTMIGRFLILIAVGYAILFFFSLF